MRMISFDSEPEAPALDTPGRWARLWRNRGFARVRHRLARLRRFSALSTRAHARVVIWSGGRIRRSFLFTGGMPILVLTTIGRRSGKQRSTPVGFLPYRDGFALLASNAGSDHPPAWSRNLQDNPEAEVLVDRQRLAVTARDADPDERERLWSTFARLNAGFDEYRRLTSREIPVVILQRGGTSGSATRTSHSARLRRRVACDPPRNERAA